MTGFRFELTLPGPHAPLLATDQVELDGVPAPGHQLRVAWHGGEQRDLWVAGITWFHAPGSLSKSGLLTLSETPP